MTTFQGLVYAVLFCLGQFLPLGGDVYAQAFAKFLHNEEAALSYAFYFFGFLALLAYFIHDWASILTSGIQTIVFRRKPTMLDERLFFFLVISTGLGIAGHTAFEWFQLELYQTFIWASVTIVALTVALWFFDGWSKRNKDLCDFGWIDSIWMGLCLGAGVFLGVGWLTSGVIGLLFRNYKREAALKLSFLAMTPYFGFLAHRAYAGLNFSGGHPFNNTSWMTLIVSGLATIILTYSNLGGLLLKIEDRTFRTYAIYRLILVAALVGLTLWKGL